MFEIKHFLQGRQIIYFRKEESKNLITDFHDCKNEGNRLLKAVRAPGKNSGGHDGGGKVVHAYHKRSSPIEVGKKLSNRNTRREKIAST